MSSFSSQDAYRSRNCACLEGFRTPIGWEQKKEVQMSISSMHVHSKSNYNDPEWAAKLVRNFTKRDHWGEVVIILERPVIFCRGQCVKSARNKNLLESPCLFSFIPNQTNNNSSLSMIHIATSYISRVKFIQFVHEVTENTTSRVAISDKHFFNYVDSKSITRQQTGL